MLPVLLLLGVPASTVRAQELLGWWSRDLLDVDLTEGGWVRYATFEQSEGRAVQDTLEVAVLSSRDDGTRWLQFAATSSDERTLLLVDPQSLASSPELLDALVRVVRVLADGTLVEEDVDEHRNSRIVQRHFQDPFQDPTITRDALTDSVIADEVIRRERVRLTEEQREERSLGRAKLVLVTELDSRAVLSPDIPVFGVWSARTSTVVTSRSEGGSGRMRTVPLETEVRLDCIDFGRRTPHALPAALRDRRP